ncbi:MAG: SDR family NAD(P)-dependent oxidoreductase [Methyloligellaceae bacterium]
MTTLPSTPSFRLDGRRALVTGGSRGIGLAGAVALAEAGAHVVITSRTKAEIEAAAAAIREAGFSAEGIAIDVSDVAAVRSLIAEQEPFHILFNNAGITRHTAMLDTTEADYDAVMDVNVKGAYFTAQAVARRMIDAGIGGSIIHTSSQMGHIGGIDRAVYCSTKHALEGLTKAMAIEFGPHGIRINTLAPTFIRTPLAELTLKDPERRAWVESKIKLGRLGELEDIMGPVLFLASDASAMMTGTSLLVDGGWTAG